MKPKPHRVAIGAAILGLSAFAVWLSVPPARWPASSAWPSGSFPLGTFLALLGAPACTARLWYARAAYFAFGAITVWPLAWSIFGPSIPVHDAESINTPAIVALMFLPIVIGGIAATPSAVSRAPRHSPRAKRQSPQLRAIGASRQRRRPNQHTDTPRCTARQGAGQIPGPSGSNSMCMDSGHLMLTGIVKENAIMMIDFGLEVPRKENKPPVDPIYEVCIVRFVPSPLSASSISKGRRDQTR